MSILDRAASPPTSSGSNQLPVHEIVIAVSNLEDLFNPPAVNPFVDRDLRALGEPALARATRELQVGRLRDRERRPVRLRIQVPTDRVSGEIGAPQVAEAIHRYCTAKMADNEDTIRLTRKRAGRGLQIAVVLVLIFAAVAFVLLTTALSQAGTVIQGIVLFSLSLFAWVVLWDTLEAWIFNPLPASFENRALARLRQAEVVVDAL